MLLIVGAGADVGDVAMNVQGRLVEERRVKVLMPYWHGTFFYRRGFRSSLRLALCLVWATTTHYLQDRIPRSCVGTGPFRRAVVSGPRTIPLSKSVTGQERRLALEPVIILLGIVIFATALGEGAANDWLALVLVDDWGAGPAISALTYGGFHLTMAVGRFTGGAKIQRHGRVPVLRWAGTLACARVTVLCLVNSTLIALLGGSPGDSDFQ